MGAFCDYCGEQRSRGYCRPYFAALCLSGDAFSQCSPPHTHTHTLTPTHRAAALGSPFEEGEATKVKREKKKKNLFDVVQFLPDWGVGYMVVAKTIWRDVPYQIAKINLCNDGHLRKAWGILHKARDSLFSSCLIFLLYSKAMKGLRMSLRMMLIN